MSRALVLGGGGLAGIAWESGVLMGLGEAGADVGGWDLVVGTSAGAVVGAKVLGEPDFGAFVGRQLIEAGPEDDVPIRLMGGRVAASLLRLGRRRGLGWAPSVWVLLFGLETFVRHRARRAPREPTRAPPPAIRRFSPPDPALARLGAFGVAARTASEATFRTVMEATLDPVREWPDRLVATAIDVATGEAVALDARSGVPFVDAIAASCAVPTFMPMITIQGRRYMDGGMASQTHADLAAGCDDVLVIAPLDLGRLNSEVERLRATGARVTVVTPGPEARRVIGRSVSLLDPARRARCAQAGLLDGRRAAESGAAAGGRVRRPEHRATLAGSEG
jgi:NTE family protein